MRNYYKERNYAHIPQIIPVPASVANSDSMYDVHKNVSHSFIPFKDVDGERDILISDVDLAFGSDPGIDAVVTPQQREQLRNGILNQPSLGSSGLSDDDLIDSVLPSGIEPSEAANIASSILSRVPEPASSEPAPSEPAPSEPAPSSTNS